MLGVSRSGYYAWKSRPPSMRSRQDAALTARIREIHQRSRQTYGSPRVHAELRALGTRCGRKRVERLMRQAELRGCTRGRGKGTTRRSKRAAPAEDLVKRDFAATQMDKVWVADITYVPTEEGFLYPGVLDDPNPGEPLVQPTDESADSRPVRGFEGGVGNESAVGQRSFKESVSLQGIGFVPRGDIGFVHVLSCHTRSSSLLPRIILIHRGVNVHSRRLGAQGQKPAPRAYRSESGRSRNPL
jgi:hypothetical protein